MSDRPVATTGREWWTWATMALALGGVLGAALLAALDHPHRAVLLLVGTLLSLAIARLLIPGRPWFASRNRWMDAALLSGIGLAMWYFSPFTATLGIG